MSTQPANDSPDAMPPHGFTPLRMRANPFIEGVGPLYGCVEGEDLLLGLRVQRRHCNPAGACHGGMVLTFSDMTLILGASHRARPSAQPCAQPYMVTVHLNCDFIALAPLGAWLQGRCEVLRASRNLVFCEGRLTADGAIVARISGLLKPLKEVPAGLADAA